MRQSGEYLIGASADVVWRALNDPEVLAQCIDGCQSMTRTADDAFTASVKMKIGPLSAVFDGEVKLADIVPPTSYTLQGSVKGGAAGFAVGQVLAVRVGLAGDARGDGGAFLGFAGLFQRGGAHLQVAVPLQDRAEEPGGLMGLIWDPVAGAGVVAQQLVDIAGGPAVPSHPLKVDRPRLGGPVAPGPGGTVLRQQPLARQPCPVPVGAPRSG